MDPPSDTALASSQAPSATGETVEARNARFDKITKELSSRRLACDEYMKAIREMFPDREEHHAFCTYDLHLSLPHLANPSGILTPARFVEIADSISFYNPTERKELLPGLEWAYRPWIPVGYEATTLYRLVPALDSLLPTSSKCPSTNRQLLSTAFLGVNLSEQSTQSAESDDADAPGFVFHQLGDLECVECETAAEMPSTLEEGDDSDDWQRTGFSVVARLSPAGHMDGVYVIYNMNPVDLETLNRVPVAHGSWGIPPSSPGVQFSCARIGNALRGFGFKFQVVWDEQVHHPVELVRTVRSSAGGAMRITVDSNYREHM